MTAKPMRATLPEPEGGKTREITQPSVPHGQQLPFIWDKNLKCNNDIASFRALTQVMINEVGGLYAFCALLGKPFTYASKISEAVNGMNNKHVHESWIVRLLVANPKNQEHLAGWVAEHYGFEPPMRLPDADEESELAAWRETAREMGDVGQVMRKMVSEKARKGVRR